MVGKLIRAAGWTAIGLALCAGCGSTKSRLATEQLLMSDAVDDAVSGIDFRSLAGQKVFFDTRYLINVKGVGFVNSEYVISSLRQQMIAADLRLQEKPEEADFVVEARVGTLGTDANELVYGIPANRGISEAATMLPNTPTLPAIPEISLARKENQFGAVKVAAYAYETKSGEPVWQSGIARARTTSQDVWLFGAGPFQQGTIHGKTRFAGSDIRLPGKKRTEEMIGGPPVPFEEEFHFRGLVDGRGGDPRLAAQPSGPDGSQAAGGNQPAKADATATPPATPPASSPAPTPSTDVAPSSPPLVQPPTPNRAPANNGPPNNAPPADSASGSGARPLPPTNASGFQPAPPPASPFGN